MTADQQLLHDFGEAIGTHDALSLASRLGCTVRMIYYIRSGERAINGTLRACIGAHMTAIEAIRGQGK